MILSSQGNRPSFSDHRPTHKIADSPGAMPQGPGKVVR
jgi:hypothetical protein